MSTTTANVLESRVLMSRAVEPAPTSESIWLRLQNDSFYWKLKATALFVQLARHEKYVCETGTQISGSGSSHLKLLGLWLHSPAHETRHARDFVAACACTSLLRAGFLPRLLGHQ